VAPGFVQANLMIVPRQYAFDFLLFCQRNPRHCPLVEVLEAGTYAPRCAPDGDLRLDLPGYRVYRHGRLESSPASLEAIWQPDLVSFLIGCSFSFEQALLDGGIPLRHIEQGRNVAMYKSTIACAPAGIFRGNAVVSMRPVKSSAIARAVEITARMPLAHGAPLHIGHPEAIGILDLACPDFGEAVPVMEDELPVFWACGVTPQYIAELSAVPFCVTHEPGCMFVTDLAA
jgi:uncharacterized protein YcsI (UPF0317 family)